MNMQDRLDTAFMYKSGSAVTFGALAVFAYETPDAPLLPLFALSLFSGLVAAAIAGSAFRILNFLARELPKRAERLAVRDGMLLRDGIDSASL